jgi:hypothetical protein
MQLCPVPKFRALDANGNPLAGGKLYSYQSGTSTPQATYTDFAGGTANANPVVLDANGEANVWLDPELSYKLVLKDSSDVEQYSVDNIIGLLTPDAVNTASIQDGAVTTAKIADDAVDASKLKDSVATDGDRAVTTNHIRDANVTRAKLATGAVAKQNVTTKTGAYTATSSDDLILCDASGGAFTVTLPAASTNSGLILTIKKTDNSLANKVTIDGNGSETIDGATTRKLCTQYESYRIISDGSNWVVLDHIIPNTVTTYTMTIGAVTSAPTKGTVVRDVAKWSRRGRHMLITYNYEQSVAGSAGTGTYLFPLPSGPTVDDTALSGATTNLPPIVGTGWQSTTANITSEVRFTEVGVYTSLTSLVMFAQVGTTGTFTGSSSAELSNATVAYSFRAEVPIADWEG